MRYLINGISSRIRLNKLNKKSSYKIIMVELVRVLLNNYNFKMNMRILLSKMKMIINMKLGLKRQKVKKQKLIKEKLRALRHYSKNNNNKNNSNQEKMRMKNLKKYL